MSKVMNKNPGIEKAILILGSQKALASAVGCAQSTVSDWLNGRKKVSPEHVPIIVRSTAGGVLGYQIRPDLPDIFHVPDSDSNAA